MVRQLRAKLRRGFESRTRLQIFEHDSTDSARPTSSVTAVVTVRGRSRFHMSA